MKKPVCYYNKSLLLFLTLAASVLTGCSPSKVPGCSEKEPLEVLDKIAISAYRNYDPEKYQHKVSSIRTRKTDDKTGAHECAADFVVTNIKNNKSANIPITYVIEKLDNSNDLVHVEVIGLKEGVSTLLLRGVLNDPIKMSPAKEY